MERVEKAILDGEKFSLAWHTEYSVLLKMIWIKDT